MPTLDLNRKIAHAEHQRKKEQEQTQDHLIRGFIWGLESGPEQGRQNPKEVLDDKELSFLIDLKANEIYLDSEARELASHHEISSERYEELKNEGRFSTMTVEEDGQANKFEEEGTLDKETLESLEKKGFATKLTSNELRFAMSLRKQDLSEDDTLQLGIMRFRHNIDDDTWKFLKNTGTVQILSKEEKSWLQKVEEGASLRNLEDEKKRLGLTSTWHLKDRISINSSGKREINTHPIWNGQEIHIQKRARLNWYENNDSYKSRQLNSSKINRKDLDLLAADAKIERFWQAARKEALTQTVQENPISTMEQLFSNLNRLEQAAVLSFDDKDLNARQTDFRAKYQKIFSEDFLSLKREERLSNDEYFFLAALRRDPKDMDRLSAQYSVSPSSLKEKSYLDYLEDDEEEILKKYANDEGLDENETEILNDLKERYFISEATTAEENFLNSISSSNLFSKNEVVEIADKHMLPEKQVEGLKARGFLSYLDDNEKSFLEAYVSDKEQDFDILAEKYDVDRPWFLKDRIQSKRFTTEQFESLKSEGFFQKLKDNEKGFLEACVKNRDKSFKNLEKEYKIGDPSLKSKVLFEAIDYSVRVDSEEKLRFNPRSQFRESKSLLELRWNSPTNSPIHPQKMDTDILCDYHSNKELSLTHFERLSEIKSHNLSLKDLPILSNTESSYIRHVAWRNWEPEKLAQIAKKDFNLDPDTFQRLSDQGFVSKSTQNKVVIHEEHRSIHEARVWINAPTSIKPKLQKPAEEIINAVKDKATPSPIGHKLMDYKIHFKVLRGEKLTKTEQQRHDHMRENGVHPGSKDFKKWVLEEPLSWRMKLARRDAYLNHYESVYGANIEALKFINTFKQVTHDQLITFGLKEDEITRYKDGISGHHKLLKKHVLPTNDGPITYYSLTHEGPISGRKFLEREGLPKKSIPKHPQTRKDLLYHDLKVVSCVQDVIEMKKKEGKKLVSIANESMQFVRAKAGKQNHERKDGPAFMDAELVFEVDEEISQSSGGGTSSETIAVEYGDYPTERMKNKLENSKFDQAFVYAKADYINRYKKKIHVPNVTFIAMK